MACEKAERHQPRAARFQRDRDVDVRCEMSEMIESVVTPWNVACELRLHWTCDLPAAHASRAKPVYKVEWWENGIPDLGIRIIGPAL